MGLYQQNLSNDWYLCLPEGSRQVRTCVLGQCWQLLSSSAEHPLTAAQKHKNDLVNHEAYPIHYMCYLSLHKPSGQNRASREKKKHERSSMPIIEDHWSSSVCVRPGKSLSTATPKTTGGSATHWLTISMSHVDSEAKAGSALIDILIKLLTVNAWVYHCCKYLIS